MKAPNFRNRARDGFALVVTLMLMVLLSILALGMLGLSSITLRSSGAVSAQMEASANARLALMLAIGELQRHAGNDMRVTAPADIVDEDNPPLLGVWRSWEGTDHLPADSTANTLAGRPVAPDYSSKDMPVSEGGRFVSWLVSGADGSSGIGDAATLVSSTASAGTIPIVSTGSLAEGDTREVHVVPREVGDNGAMAWWISGENQKALIPKPYADETPSIADWADRNRSHQVADPKPFHLEAVLDDPTLGPKALTLASADIIAGPAAPVMTRENFHDLSPDATGLLTNTATGGWRKDFSLLTEKWDEQPTSGLEFFKVSPSEHLQYTRPASLFDPTPKFSMLYYWSDYRTSTLREFWARRGPIASWAKIKTYATLYKDMSSTSSNAPNINHRSWPDIGADTTQPNATLTFHDIRLMPQMARVQMIVSHYATQTNAAPGKYRPAVLYTPIVTIWNPYNTRLTLNGRLRIMPAEAWPLALKHKFTGAGAPALADEYWAVQGGSPHADYVNKRFGASGTQQHRLSINQNPNPAIFEPIILEPGETRIFSPSTVAPQEVTTSGQPTINLAPGVRTGVGIFYALDRRLAGLAATLPYDSNVISLPGSVTMDVDAKFDVTARNHLGISVCGSSYQWFVDSNFGSGQSHSWFNICYLRSDADQIYPPKTGLASATLAQCSTTPVPFLSMILGSRIANFRATATKGVVQAEPVVDFFSSNPYNRFTDKYPGADTLLNCPWDFSLVEHASGADDMLPNADNTTNSSYIVTGVRKADGVSRIVAAELPTRPLVSLADLTHMQIRALNPTPPYGGNLVANSDASPLIPQDSVVNSPTNTRANLRSNEQQDDSYCVNHVLFDDWFFSSIAPKPAGFGPSGGADLRQNYLDFLTGKDPLANRAYLAIREDQATTEAEAGETYADEVEPADSWKTIASRLEVEGMFNVNSTSVKAWRALLGHARNQKIPYTQPSGSIALTGDTDYAFSRTSVAGDRAAGEAPQNAGEYADTTEFTGHRVFTDEMLDFLAKRIVEQVRLRGPFLSLSEFVNRQLSSDADLALGGTIQVALNALAEDSSLNPFETIQNESVESLAQPFGIGPNTGYVFPDAAAGYNTYGLPGWTRQADVLRPLAPILSARDDTFTIRAYGESRAADGKVVARAWCEATVRRTRDFLDPADEPDIFTQPTSETNLNFGRRFALVSFRWLSPEEV